MGSDRDKGNMKIKIMKLVIGLFITSLISAYGQSSSVTLNAPSPIGVSGVSVTRVGNPGNNNFYYWVVANYVSGQGNGLIPAQMPNAPSTLDGSNYVRINWNFTPGAISYDVLRTTTSSVPNPCTCALATGLTTFTYNNQNNTLSSYTYAPVGPATASLSLNNTAYTLPRGLFNRQLDFYLGPYTIAGSNPLPTPDPLQKYRFQVITDGTSSTDCTVGGGSGLVVCIDNGTSWVSAGTGGSGAGTVTNTSWTGGIVSIANSTTTPAFTIAGTSGGIVYFSATNSWASSGLLAANLPVIGGGAGVAPTTGTRTGNTTKFATSTGSLVTDNCAKWDSSGNIVDAGAACGSGSGGSTPKHTIVSFVATPTFTVLANSDPMVFTITLTGNVTSSTLDVTAAVDGQEIVFEVCTDATASRTFVPPTNVSGMQTIIAQASKCSRQNFYYNSNSGNTVAIAPMICPTCDPGGLGTSPGNIATATLATLATSATALASTPSLCSTGNAPTGILANGNATGCAAIGGGGGSGTVTSVGFTGGLISVANPTTTPALTVVGTPGGVPYFSASSTWASSSALTANLPVIGGGAGAAPTVGNVSGNTTTFVTTTGTQTSGRCVTIDANGNHVADSAACGSGVISGLTTNKLAKAASSTTIADSSVSDDGTTVSTAENLTVGSGTTTGASVVAGNATGDTGASSFEANSGDGASNTEPGFLKLWSSHTTKRKAALFPCTNADGFFCIATGTPAADASNIVLTTDNTATLTNKSLSIGQVTGLGTNVGTFLATPSSANLLSALTTKTGTGSAMFGTSPTATGLTLGDVATGTQCLHANSSGIISGTGSDCQPGGIGSAGSPLFVQTASTTVTSNSETTLLSTGQGSTTIPANWFSAAGSVMEVCASGIYTTAVTPGTIRFKMKFGSTVITDTGAFTPAISITNGVYAACVHLTARTVGASGTIMASDILPISAAVLALGGATFTNPTPGTAVTVDTTGTLTMDFTVTFSLNATNSITSTNFYMVSPGSAISSVNGKTGAVVLGLASADFANQGTTTTFLKGNGSGNPSFSAVGLTTDVSGVLPIANGGTGTASTLTGLVRGNASAMTAAELSGDCATSGSNAILCTQVNGSNFTVNSSGVPTKIAGVTTVGLGAIANMGESNVTAQSTSQSTVTLATSPPAGNYEIHFIVDMNTPCTTGSNGVTFAFSWTGNSARTLTTGTFTMNAAQATNEFGNGVIPIKVVSGNVNYISTVSGTCTSGTSSYDINAWLVRAK